jgi:hypothetical protein
LGDLHATPPAGPVRPVMRSVMRSHAALGWGPDSLQLARIRGGLEQARGEVQHALQDRGPRGLGPGLGLGRGRSDDEQGQEEERQGEVVRDDPSAVVGGEGLAGGAVERLHALPIGTLAGRP